MDDDVIEFDTLDFLASFFFRDRKRRPILRALFLGGAKKCGGDHQSSYHIIIDKKNTDAQNARAHKIF